MSDTLTLITLPGLGTIGGLTLATTAVTSGLARAVNWSPAWLGLAVALILCLATTFFSGNLQPVDWFLAILNGFVVYLASAGATGAGAALERGRSGGHETTHADTPGFFRPWF